MVDEPEEASPSDRHAAWRAALRHDLSRHERRAAAHGSFWRYLALLGSVGWPIVLLGVGGAWLGQMLDPFIGQGLRCTASLLVFGILLGSWIAWKQISEDRR